MELILGKAVVNSVKEHGVRVGDSLQVTPVMGRKGMRTLVRKRLQIALWSNHLPLLEGDSWALPRFGGESGGPLFELLLVEEDEAWEGAAEGGRYLLRSKGRVAFQINGVTSFESFIERFDKVVIGQNVLTFLPGNESQQEFGEQSMREVLGPAITWNMKVLPHDVSVLLEGETGTGKSYFAKEIYQKIGRRGAFVHLNLSAFAPSLLESELFGHVKGAFTGAFVEKKGAIREANGGTLFLDEVDSLPKSLQVKLLLFLDSKRIRVVGGCGEIQCDVQIIISSRVEAELLLKRGEWREDFYYRVTSGIRYKLPHLRDHPAAIKKLCSLISRQEEVVMSAGLISLYTTLSWPGNLRQLISHVKRKKIYAHQKQLEIDEMDEELLQREGLLAPEEVFVEKLPFATLEEMKRMHVAKVYKSIRSVESVAKILDISPNTVRSLMRA
ncbi:MAG: sigma 54-interacting transcriptional regulator [Oligoflexia bacterium]|nr:sigma 54-interacting transcriptional regulator [Oligoflexia bacterium]